MSHVDTVPKRVLQVALSGLLVYEKPTEDACLVTELLCGEEIAFHNPLEIGWNRGIPVADKENAGYIRYFGTAFSPLSKPTHRVGARLTIIYNKPSVKSPLHFTKVLGMNSLVSVAKTEGDFSCIGDGQWVFTPHLAPVVQRNVDRVKLADSCLHAPYLWGGRNPAHGLDCSGLVNAVFAPSGTALPHNCALMEMYMERNADAFKAVEAWKVARGDIVFWEGHVAIVAAVNQIIHATAEPHCRVVRESFRDVIGRKGPIKSAFQPLDVLD